FQEYFVDLGFSCLGEQRAQQPAAVAEPLRVGMDTEIQHVGLGRGDRHDRVTADGARDFEDETIITRQQAITEDAEAPRVVVSRALDLGDRLEVTRQHQPDLGIGTNGCAHQSEARSARLYAAARVTARPPPVTGLCKGPASSLPFPPASATGTP